MNYQFSENEDVAHIDNLTQKLTVKKLKYIHTKVEGTDKTRRRFNGCLCYWWNGSKLEEAPFHAERLVPWEYAKKGREISVKWLMDMGAKIN